MCIRDRILYQNYNSTRKFSGYIISIFIKHQYCVRLADTADPEPELQRVYIRIHNFHFRQTPILCPYWRYSRYCTRTTDPVPELQRCFEDTQFPFSPSTNTVPVLQMQQIMYQNYKEYVGLHTVHVHAAPILCACYRCSRSCTRTTKGMSGYILSMFTQHQYLSLIHIWRCRR